MWLTGSKTCSTRRISASLTNALVPWISGICQSSKKTLTICNTRAIKLMNRRSSRAIMASGPRRARAYLNGTVDSTSTRSLSAPAFSTSPSRRPFLRNSFRFGLLPWSCSPSQSRKTAASICSTCDCRLSFGKSSCRFKSSSPSIFALWMHCFALVRTQDSKCSCLPCPWCLSITLITFWPNFI